MRRKTITNTTQRSASRIVNIPTIRLNNTITIILKIPTRIRMLKLLKSLQPSTIIIRRIPRTNKRLQRTITEIANKQTSIRISHITNTKNITRPIRKPTNRSIIKTQNTLPTIPTKIRRTTTTSTTIITNRESRNYRLRQRLNRNIVDEQRP